MERAQLIEKIVNARKALADQNYQRAWDELYLPDDASVVQPALLDAAATEKTVSEIIRYIHDELGPYGDCRTGCWEMIQEDIQERFAPTIRKETTTDGH